MDPVYANVVTTETSVFDFCFIFGLRDQSQAAGNTFTQTAKVYMSPQHTKAFYNVLKSNLELYEQQFGKIELPKEISVQVEEIVPATNQE